MDVVFVKCAHMALVQFLHSSSAFILTEGRNGNISGAFLCNIQEIFSWRVWVRKVVEETSNLWSSTPPAPGCLYIVHWKDLQL